MIIYFKDNIIFNNNKLYYIRTMKKKMKILDWFSSLKVKKNQFNFKFYH